MLRSPGCTRSTRFKPPTHAHLQACAWKYAESRHWMLFNCEQPHPVISMPTQGQQARSADLHPWKSRPIQKRLPYCLYCFKHCCWCGGCRECAMRAGCSRYTTRRCGCGRSARPSRQNAPPSQDALQTGARAAATALPPSPGMVRNAVRDAHGTAQGVPFLGALVYFLFFI